MVQFFWLVRQRSDLALDLLNRFLNSQVVVVGQISAQLLKLALRLQDRLRVRVDRVHDLHVAEALGNGCRRTEADLAVRVVLHGAFFARNQMQFDQNERDLAALVLEIDVHALLVEAASDRGLDLRVASD